jgi:tellurite resistance protein TehA-like permease
MCSPSDWPTITAFSRWGCSLSASSPGCCSPYAVPWTAVLSRTERPVLSEADGTWFIWVVAVQSIATASASLEPLVSTGRGELAVVAVVAWSVGIVLYAACAVFVALRLMLYPLRPRDLDPPYWVAMGAAAITVVAAAPKSSR